MALIYHQKADLVTHLSHPAVQGAYMGHRNLGTHIKLSLSNNPDFFCWHLEEANELLLPMAEQRHIRYDNHGGLSTLGYQIESDDCFSALGVTNQSPMVSGNHIIISQLLIIL